MPEKVKGIQDELGGLSSIPPPVVTAEAWNSDRLNACLDEIDVRITAGNHEGAVTLAYTCLEGFLKAFIIQNVPQRASLDDIVDLSRAVQSYLKGTIQGCPDEALTMINHIAHTVDRVRNQFSESHFADRAQPWLAVLTRDLVNAEIRLLLNFLGP